MSNACDTLSPRPPVLTGPTSTISADDFLGLENEHGEGSIRSNRNEVMDLENGDGRGPSAERNEISVPSEAGRCTTRYMNHSDFYTERIVVAIRNETDGRPKLIQRSKTPKNAHSTICAVGMT